MGAIVAARGSLGTDSPEVGRSRSKEHRGRFTVDPGLIRVRPAKVVEWRRMIHVCTPGHRHTSPVALAPVA